MAEFNPDAYLAPKAPTFDPDAFLGGATPIPKAGQVVPQETSPLAASRNIAAGVMRGARDPIDAGAQMLTRGLEDLAPEGSWFQQYMQGERKRVEDINRGAEKDYMQNWGGAAPEAGYGRMAGNVMATAPIAAAMPGASAASLPARMASGAASGAVTGALQPTDPNNPDFWGTKAEQAGMGALGGAGAPLATGTAARMIRPNTSPEVQALMQRGVTTTPGQTLGGWANRLEEGAQSIPFVGDVIKSARRRSVETFNRAAVNEALAPIGYTVPRNTPMGHQVIDAAHDIVGQQYDNLLPHLRVRADPQFVNNMQNVLDASTHLEPNMAQTFTNILRDKIFHRFAPNGGMTGNDFKTMESELGRLARGYSKSQDAGQRELGGALRQTQAELRDLLERSNPTHREELRNINQAYSGLLRVEGAAGKLGADQGVFTPAQLLNSVRSLDPSMRKGAFARGNAPMQELAEQGKEVLGSKVPDSGTPYRAMTGLLGGLGVGAIEPTGIGLGTTLGAAGLSSLYTRPGTAAMRALLARRPDLAAPAASVVRRSTPAVTPFSALMAQQQE
jgi:hypothetical protein